MPIVNRSSPIFKIVSLSVVVILAVVIGKIFIDNWTKIPFEDLTFDYRLLFFAFLLSIVNSIFPTWLWEKILHLLDEKPRFMDLWRISMYSQMARYIPGKIWQYMGKIYWGQKVGLPKKKILISTLLETIFLLCGAFILSMFSLKIFLSGKSIVILFILIFLVLIALHPKLIEKCINIIGKKWLSQPVTIQFSYWNILTLVTLYSVLWVMIGFQLYLFVLSFYKIPLTQFIYFSSINAASWLIGFVSIIAPSGLVVKEGVFIFGFKYIVPVSFAIFCAILIRFFHLITELLITSIFFIFDKGAWKNFFEFKKSLPKLRTDNNDKKE